MKAEQPSKETDRSVVTEQVIEMKDNFPYKDIIDLPHYQSASRKHMSLYNRAAQFSPYAALVGYDEIIAETGRLTDDKLELPEHVQAELDRKFMLLQAIIDEGGRPEITVTYFVPDKTKSGGRYETFIGEVKRVDTTLLKLIFYDHEKDLSGTTIDIPSISDIDGDIFDEI